MLPRNLQLLIRKGIQACKIAFAFFLMMYCSLSFAQNGSCHVTVQIVDEEDQAILGAYAEIVETGDKAVTDTKGQVKVWLAHQGVFTIKVQVLGFTEKLQTLSIADKSTMFTTIRMQENAKELDAIVIKGDSEQSVVSRSPYKAEVIGMESIRAQPIEVTSILNRVAGIRIRQEGGNGSDTNIMLNGIDGKGIKVFVDGIPVYLLGAGYSINTFSPNMIEHIEVYKGTIPVAFGSDALGGVINLVTRQGNVDYADVSYSYGSWNTRKMSVNTRKKFGKSDNFFVSLDGFYNHSDNDYWIDNVDVVVDDLFNTEKGSVRRFNDHFESLLGRAQLGARDLSWADELMLVSSYSAVDKELQHGIRAEVPWGKPESVQKSWNVAGSWKKSGKDEKWYASVTAGYTRDDLNFIDTTRSTYYWDQNFVEKSNGGESGLYSNGTTPVIITNTFFSRESFNYSFDEFHTLNLTMLLTKSELNVSNEAFSTDNQERLALPQELLKNYTGLSLESDLLRSRVTNILSVKHFYTNVSGSTFGNRVVGG